MQLNNTIHTKISSIIQSLQRLNVPVDKNMLQFRRDNTYILACVALLLISMSYILNIYKETTDIIPILYALAVFIIFSTIRLYVIKTSFVLSQIIIILSLSSLGFYLLTYDTSYLTNSSILWLTLAPSLIMFSMGLRNGTIMFALYYIALLTLIVSPLNVYLNDSVTIDFRIRLLLVTFGGFIFSWSAEFVRFKTQLALTEALAFTEKMALTDKLTGIGNRRYFDTILPLFTSGAKRKNTFFSMALIDLDFFKNVNDTYGHLLGDQVLIHIASMLTTMKRDSDFLFRWGGEEFVLLIAEIDYIQTLKLANRICTYIAAHPFEANNIYIPVTVSIGIAVGKGEEDIDFLIRVADENLYKAKNAGRNQVIG